MGFRFVVMFNDSFMDDVIYVRDVEVCMLAVSLAKNYTNLCVKCVMNLEQEQN